MKRIAATVLFVLLSLQSVYAQGYICAIGGGSENYNDWSDAPYQWIVQKSNSGKIIILSVNDETTWIPNYFISFGASSAVNKKINTRTLADAQATYDEIVTAKAVFIKGGDQWNYVNLWKGTKTEDAIKEVYRRGGVIAGTSAGAMVLGGIDFTAQFASPTSREALISPFSSANSLDTAFLPFLPRVIFDTHVAERGRQGRLIAFMGKVKNNFNISPVGVGVDDRTAICIDSSGIGTVMGSGAVAVFYEDAIGGIDRNSFAVSRLRCDQLISGWQFNFRNTSLHYIPSTARSRDSVLVFNEQLKSQYFSGSNALTLTQALAYFRSEQGRVTILTHPGAVAKVNSLKVHFGNRAVRVVPVSTGTINDAYYRDSLSAGTNILVYADSLAPMLLLNDTLSVLGAEFKRNMNTYKMCWIGTASRLIGAVTSDNVDTDPLAAFRGKMTFAQGWNIQPCLNIQPMLYDSTDYYENRFSALMYSLFKNRNAVGVATGTTDYLNYQNGVITYYGAVPFFVVSSAWSRRADSSTYRATSSTGPRQIVGMDNLRYTILAQGNSYSIRTNSIVILDKINEKDRDKADALVCQYPNPVTKSGVITISGNLPGMLNWEIYSVTGELINKGIVGDGISDNIFREYNIPAPPGSNGVYILKMTGPSGFNRVLKIVTM